MLYIKKETIKENSLVAKSDILPGYKHLYIKHGNKRMLPYAVA